MEKILYFDQGDLQEMDKRYRANFINSITGYKSANLLGTISKSGVENLAIFSSVVHLGSNPALLGFIMRPTTVPRHTYSNIKETGVFTVNHIHKDIVKAAHHTAARFDQDVSEFDAADLHSSYENHCKAPFVKEAHIRMACSYVNEYAIKENGTLLIVGAIDSIYVPEKALDDDGWIHLEKASTVSINGLDGYSHPQLIDRFAYAKPDQPVVSILKK